MTMKPVPRDFRKTSRRLGFLFIIWVFLLSQGISQADSATSVMPITCKVVPTIEASFPESLEFTNAAPTPDLGDSYIVSEPQVVKIWSNTGWALKMKSDSIDGRMREWTGNEYSSKTLSFPLEWRANEEDDFIVMRGEDAMVVQNAAPTDQYGTAITLLFRQIITYKDTPLPDPLSFYKIQVTFTAVQTY
jgi:hypothetical protein